MSVYYWLALSAPTAEISVVQECGSVYNEEWIVPICGTDNE